MLVGMVFFLSPSFSSALLQRLSPEGRGRSTVGFVTEAESCLFVTARRNAAFRCKLICNGKKFSVFLICHNIGCGAVASSPSPRRAGPFPSPSAVVWADASQPSIFRRFSPESRVRSAC